MTYMVNGGIHTDETFTQLQTIESYGPFDTYDQAKVEWRRRTFTQLLGNCYHKLYITKVPKPIYGAEILRRQTRPDND